MSSSSTKKEKVFMPDFSGRLFSFDDLDVVLCGRLAKRRDENKFTFLFESYERLESHVVSKMKQFNE